MARGPIYTLMGWLRKSVGQSAAHDLSDAALLERFALHRDKAAFEVLLQRFGPMVFGVCNRVLRDTHAAEDAFQATFLVLAKKARSLASRELIGNWLWGVAYRTATRVKADSARWHSREGQVRMLPTPEPIEDVIWRDIRSVLDEEIERLPIKYRRAVVLCYLEGKTNEQAARMLCCPLGTVFTRLAQARELLRGRLTRRGVTLSATAFAGALAREATAGVPVALVGSTVHAASFFAAGNTAAAGVVSARAVTLAEGALKAMFISKLKITVAVLFVVLTLGSAGTLYGYRAFGGATPDPQHGDNRVAAIGTEQTAPEQLDPEARPSTKASDEPNVASEAKTEALEQSSDDDPRAGQGIGFGAGFGQGSGFGQGFGVGQGVGVGIGNGSKLSALLEKDVQKELELSVDQLKRIRGLQSKQQKALQGMVPQNPLDAFKDPAATMKNMQAAADKMKEMTKEIDNAIDGVLSEKQSKRLREIILQQQRGHALQDPKVAQTLDLTKEQQSHLQEIAAAGMKKMQDLGLETMGTLWKGGPNPVAFQKASEKVSKQMREIWDQTGEEILGILTTEQRSKWRELTGKPFTGKKP